jgi:hypothetical protein
VLVGAVVHECHVLDHGPGGVLGGLRATIYAELGLPAPAVAATAPPGTGAAVSEDDIRQALRDIDRPSELMASPLTALVEGGPEAAAGAVRALLLAAIDGAFGDGRDEELLRDVALGAYRDPSTTHEDVAYALHVSRATYFRRLRQANERICDFVLAAATARAAGDA